MNLRQKTFKFEKNKTLLALSNVIERMAMHYSFALFERFVTQVFRLPEEITFLDFMSLCTV